MTTIIATEDYMIADHRVSSPIPKNSGFSDITNPNNKELYEYTDASNKIMVLNLKEPLVNKDGARYLYLSTAGNRSFGRHLREILEYGPRNTEERFRWFSKAARLTALQAVLLAEDGTKLVVRFNTNNPDVTHFGRKQDVAIGSGTRVYESLRRLIPDGLTIEEKFILCSCLDRFSSQSYSVAGVREKILYANVIPPQEYFKERLASIWSRLDIQKLFVNRRTNVIVAEEDYTV